jgi:segregation and condensation protein B
MTRNRKTKKEKAPQKKPPETLEELSAKHTADVVPTAEAPETSDLVETYAQDRPSLKDLGVALEAPGNEEPKESQNVEEEEEAPKTIAEPALSEHNLFPEANDSQEAVDPESILGNHEEDAEVLIENHLKGVLEALIFASDGPITALQLARSAEAPVKEVRPVLVELQKDYAARGIQLAEVGGGYLFRTAAIFAPFVRDMTKQKPVKLSRAQIETLAILAYRQPITRPEIDEIRGVDSGPVLKLLLERELIRILGKKDEPGRPLIYGTTPKFLEFFSLKSLKDMPTLQEFTELNEDSIRIAEAELGDAFTNPPVPAVPTEGAEPNVQNAEGPGPEDMPDEAPLEAQDLRTPFSVSTDIEESTDVDNLDYDDLPETTKGEFTAPDAPETAEVPAVDSEDGAVDDDEPDDDDFDDDDDSEDDLDDEDSEDDDDA